MSEAGNVVLPEVDHELLNAYRFSFTNAYENVFTTVRSRFDLEPTGRQPKTIGAIISKLKRQPTTRLSQMQDIAGCRVVIPAVQTQDATVSKLREAFPTSQVDDRRQRPSYGYRAVHVIIQIEGKAVEVQGRTALQHGWAEVSEKLADRFGLELKYGQGPHEIRDLLDRLSQAIGFIEAGRLQFIELSKHGDELRQTWKTLLRHAWWKEPIPLIRMRWSLIAGTRALHGLAANLEQGELRLTGVIAHILEVAERSTDKPGP